MWHSTSVPAARSRCVYCTKQLGEAEATPIIIGRHAGAFTTRNWTCSLGCAMAVHISARDEVALMYQTMWAREVGAVQSPAEAITARPPRELLDIFNGPMTREQWEAEAPSIRRPQHMCEYVDAPQGVLAASNVPEEPPPTQPPRKRVRKEQSRLTDLLRRRATAEQ